MNYHRVCTVVYTDRDISGYNVATMGLVKIFCTCIYTKTYSFNTLGQICIHMHMATNSFTHDVNIYITKV